MNHSSSRTHSQRSASSQTPAKQRLMACVVLGLCAALLVACNGNNKSGGETEADSMSTEVRKSPNDERDYRYLTLPNKMRVLLVSDATTDKAAAALAVYRGSFHEPEERPGLAHFLEHMLFIGTEKYPEVDTFQQFITGNGGSSNAYTAPDHTNYFFDVQPTAFREGLDRFAQFFIAPLLSADYVEREKNAVHSEYQMQYKDDGWRGFMVSKRALNPAHPAQRFTIGSLETLAGDLNAELRAFFDASYSADQMGLVALSNESLDEMEAWIAPLFNQVANRDIGPSYPGVKPITENEVPAMLTSKPLKDSYSVSYNFPIPNPRPYYREKPQTYISNLIGHEGEGSLHQLLTNKGWIESLGAGSQDLDRNNSVLAVSIQLTEAGRTHVAEISDLLFQYIDLLRASKPESWRYQEQANIAAMAFQFQEKGSPQGFVYQAAPRLDEYPPADLLISPYLMERFDAVLIKEYLDYLTPENVLVEVVDPAATTNKTETYFDVDFALNKGPIPRKPVADAALQLPVANPYLPENLALVSDDNAPISRLKETAPIEMWLDTDTEFGGPRANLLVRVVVPGGLHSASDSAMSRLYTSMVNDSLSATIYPAYLAGLSYQLGSSDTGFTIGVSGYEDKQMQLVETVLDALISAPLPEDRFASLKTSLLKAWQNRTKDKPYTQTLTALSDTLLQATWPAADLINALTDVTLKDLVQWRQQRLAEVGVISGLHGNVTIQDARALGALLQEKLQLVALKPQRSELNLIDENMLLDLQVDHDDAAMLIYVQDSGEDYKSRALSALAGQLLRSPYFSDLRTNQQLGYVVSAGSRRLLKRSGMLFLVQSPVAGVTDLEQATSNFLQTYLAAWPELSETEFAQQKAGLINRLMEKDKNLGERSQRYWAYLTDENYQFDSRAQIAAEVDQLSKQDMAEFFKSLQERISKQRLLIYSEGKFGQTPTMGKQIARGSL